MLKNNKPMAQPRKLGTSQRMWFALIIALVLGISTLAITHILQPTTTLFAQTPDSDISQVPEQMPDQNQPMSFGYDRGIQFIDPDGLNYVPFWSVNGGTVDFTLYELPVGQFLNNYQIYQYYQDQTWDIEGLTVQGTWQNTAPSNNGDTMLAVDLPASTPSGLYIIEASQGETKAMSMIVVGRNVLLLKRGNQGQVVAWTSALQGGAPATGMTVTVYDADGAVMATGDTNDIGVATLTVDDNAGENPPVMAVAKSDNETTVAGFDWQWQSYAGNYWYGANANDYTIYLHTDRSIYRPGHTIFFNGIVRERSLSNDEEGYAPIAASTVMSATLRDSRNIAVSTVEVTADSMGTVNGSFTLGDEPPLGTYNVELMVNGQTHRQQLKVEEYVKPEYQVEVSTPADFAIVGDDIPVTVDANYFFGQPVTNASVTLQVYRQPIYRYWWWWLDDLYVPYADPSGLVETYTGTTDENGQFTTTFTPSEETTYGAIYRFDATVTDAQEKPIQGSSSVRLYWNTFDLNVSTDRYGYTTDDPVTVNLSAKNHDGTPVIGQVIDIKVIKDYWNNENQQDVVLSGQVATDAAGKGTYTFESVPQGWYRLVATSTDDRGRSVETRRYLWVYNPVSNDWWYTSNNDITLMLDNDSYAPGDTAQLLIQSRVQGVALLTIERDQVIEEKIVNIEGPVTTVDIDITESHVPNVFARVHIFKPRVNDDFNPNSEGDLVFAQTELTVNAEDKRLTVEVTADAPQYLPGGEAQVTIKLTDHAGQPVAGRVALAMVDEAIFALQEDLSADIFDTFYGKRNNYGVGTFHSLTRRPYYYFWDFAADEAADGGAPVPAQPVTDQPEAEFQTDADADDSADGSEPRRNFLDTAYWNPTIDIDASGEATITIPLPDNLTTWRIIARAVTVETLVGETTSNILVTKELISRPTLPRFAVLGDLFRTSMVAQNYTGGDLVGTGLLETENLLVLNDPSQPLELPDKGSDVGRWTSVASAVGTGLVTTSLDTPAGQDIVELPFSVKPFAVPDRWTTSGQANPTATETFTIPLNAVNEMSQLTLRLSPSIALGLLDGLDDLIAYPYGCVEQTMSRVLPSAVATQAYNDLGLTNPKADELPKIITQGLQKLYGYQHSNGTWGWFYDDDGGLYLTSYVLFGLTMVEQAGFAVDPTVVDNGFAALDRLLLGEIVAATESGVMARQQENSSGDIRAYALYVKAVAGRGNLAASESLAAESESLSADALAMLAMALHIDGNTTLSQTLVDQLLAKAEVVGGTAFWPGPMDSWQWWHWRTMASSEKNTAVAVSALTQLRPDSEILPLAVRWLMDHRRGAGWRNTQATSFAVLGLVDYIKVSGELDSDYTYNVHLNGTEIASGAVTPETVTEPIEPIVVAGTEFNTGDNELVITREAAVQAAALSQQNPLYYTALLEQELYYDGFASVSSVDQGLSLSRSYNLVEGEAREDGAYNVGDIVEVTLNLEIKSEVWYLLLEDPIPAGFEALNTNVNPYSYSDVFWPWSWRSWGYNRKDVRDDRVDFFITHGWAGKRQLVYQMRATTAGVFSVPPGQVYPMYAEEMWARTSSMQVAVAPETLADRPVVLADMDNNCRVEKFDALLIADAWRTANERRDVTADGTIDLLDIINVNNQRGVDCNSPELIVHSASVGSAAQTSFLVLLPDNEESREVGDEFRAYIMADSSENLGGFEMTLNHNNALEVVDVIMSGNLGSDVYKLGPKIDKEAGRVTFGMVEIADDGVSDQVVASSVAADNAVTMMTIVFRAQRVGDGNISASDVLASDSAGNVMAATVDTQFTVNVDGERVFLPLVAR
ncbi:MAG: MG2 domain-containing protein [Chloroflexota bacterium]